MRSEPTSQHAATLRDYLYIARRRKWIIVQAMVLVPLAALAFSLSQPAQYQAMSKVLISTQDIGAELAGTSAGPSTSSGDLQTQAELARIPAVAQRAVAALHLNMTPGEFLGATGASASTTSSILTFTASSSEPRLAARMATAYARAYVRYRFASETSPIKAAREGLEKTIAATPAGSLRNTLIAKEQTLAEIAALMTNDASVVDTAQGAVQTAPHTRRNTILAVMLGLVLGIGLAFVRETLDTRVRSAEAIRDRLGLPLLGRLPHPPRKIRENDRLVMLEEPAGLQAEAFRVLKTNLEFSMLGKNVQTVMVTSAVEQEGKSTTIANLAVALARAGQRVVLVDLDLRRPYLDRFFGIGGRPGLTTVAIGKVPLAGALVDISLARSPSAAIAHPQPLLRGNPKSNGGGDLIYPSLRVLGSGPIPPDPGEFVATDRLTEILAELRQDADIVLIDAPPLFHVGDALVLSAKTDAVLVVARMEILRRPMLAELRRLLDSMPCAKLGFVATSAESDEGYGSVYGGYYRNPYEQPAEDVIRS